MLEKVIALFERLVVAHEKLAESQEAILNVGVDPGKPGADHSPEPEKPKATRAKKDKPVEPETPKAEPAKPKATLADVKMAVQMYAKSREGASSSPKDDARALMAHFGGGAKKTDEIAEEYWQEVIDACNSGWAPINEEL